MSKSKFLLEYSFVEYKTYDSGEVNEFFRKSFCSFSVNLDSFDKAREYAQKIIIPKIIDLENRVKFSKSILDCFKIENVSLLLEF